jgi:hypothetical protein
MIDAAPFYSTRIIVCIQTGAPDFEFQSFMLILKLKHQEGL